MDKLSMQSVDGVAANIDIIARHFPSCITEARDSDGQLVHGIDFEKLKAELSSSCIPEKAERYQFTWPGKMDAARLANQPSAATLRPCREESVDFDTTSNLYIEGDNLEVLKVLRNTYAGKVKMIYIDPPYNTGNDFIYEDDFAIDRDDFLVQSGQIGADGERLVVNSDTNGRFHTDWLNMIYPRLKLAREFLSEDGVIFISIDDHEVDNLRKVCSEVFGEQNMISQLVWQRTHSLKNDAKFISVSHDYILMYVKDINQFKIGRLEMTAEALSRYDNPDNDPRGPWQSVDMSAKTYTESCDYEIVTPAGKSFSPAKGRSWQVSKARYEEMVRDNRIYFGKAGTAKPRLKVFLNERKNEGLTVPQSILLYKDVGHTQSASQELKELLGDKVFDGPKPVSLLTRLITLANLHNDSIVLDFFSGSATTAHALMKFNAEEDKNCSFIVVQIPAVMDSQKTDGKAEYKTICEVGEERIRRAGAAIKAESGLMAGDLDTGFRVLKLDSSNMMDVYYSADEVSLPGFSEFNIKDDRSGEDLLFQVMLDLGIELSSTIEVKNLAGHTVHVVDGGYLAACFDDRVSVEAARAIAGLNPHWFVMCDAAFGSDADADNIMQVFKAVSPMSQIRVI